MATYLSFWGLIIGALGIAGTRYEMLSPLFGFYTVVVGGCMMLLGLLWGLVIWRRFGRAHAPWLALVLGCTALGAGLYVGARAGLHPLSDVSTDTQNPPQFLGPLYTVEAKGPDGLPDPAFLWPRAYDPAGAPTQKSRYPKLTPLLKQGSPEKLFPAVAQALRGLPEPWRVTFEDPSRFHVELTRKNALFHFVDDVAIEVRAVGSQGQSSTIEIRSRARWAFRAFGFTSDFGTGARRVEYLRGLLETATAAAEKGEVAARRAAVPGAPPLKNTTSADPTVAKPSAAPATAPPAAPAPKGNK